MTVLRELQQPWRNISCRWRAVAAPAAPVRPWRSAQRHGGLWRRQHRQGSRWSSADTRAASAALGKSYKGKAGSISLQNTGFPYASHHLCLLQALERPVACGQRVLGLMLCHIKVALQFCKASWCHVTR